MSAEPVILSAGRLYCDVIFTGLPRMPTPGTEVFCDGVGFHVGGGAAITAGHLGALGNRTALAATLPAPPIDALILGELAAPGVDLTLCHPAPVDAAPQMTVALAHNGERAFVTHRTGPAIPDISADAARNLGVTHIHIGEMTTLVEHPGLLTLARELDATLSLDCSWDDHLDPAKIEILLPKVDVFLPNEAEAGMLQQLGISNPFARTTVIKRGKDGALAICGDRRLHAPAKPAKVLDTTGAGDAFNAGFLDAWLRKAPLEACLAAGNARGAEAVTYRGGLRL